MGKRALVVGIGNYATLRTLRQAPIEAHRIGSLLHKAGWSVSPLVDDAEKNSTSQSLWQRTRDFFLGIRVGEDALFYFSGHAQQDGSEIRLVGYDGLDNTGGVSFGELKSWIPVHAHSVTLFLDCCNSGDFVHLAHNLHGERTDISVFAACGPNEKAWSDADNGNIFSKYLRDGLGDGVGLDPGPVTPTVLRHYIHNHYAFELLDISREQWQEPHYRIAEVPVVLVTIPETGDSRASRRALDAPSALRSESEGDVEVTKSPQGLLVSWIVRPTGRRIPWQLPVPVRFDERPVAVRSTRDKSAVYLVLTGGGRTRVVKAVEGAVIAGMTVDGIGEIGPAEAAFGVGGALGKVSIAGLNRPIDLTTLRTDAAGAT